MFPVVGARWRGLRDWKIVFRNFFNFSNFMNFPLYLPSTIFSEFQNCAESIKLVSVEIEQKIFQLFCESPCSFVCSSICLFILLFFSSQENGKTKNSFFFNGKKFLRL